MTGKTVILFLCQKRGDYIEMKYGVAVSIIETGYVEVDADCEEEAKQVAGEAALDGRVLFHEAEVHEAKVESVWAEPTENRRVFYDK